MVSVAECVGLPAYQSVGSPGVRDVSPYSLALGDIDSNHTCPVYLALLKQRDSAMISYGLRLD